MRRAMTEYSLKAKLTAEFIGTFFLSLTVCTAAVHGLAGGYAPFAIASVLMVMIYATGYGFETLVLWNKLENSVEFTE